MRLIFSDRWQRANIPGGELIYRGNQQAAQAIAQAGGSIEKITQILSALKHYSCGVVTDGDTTIAWCDHIRAWPLFYREDNQSIASEAVKLLDAKEGFKHDGVSALELVTSGYVTGRHTLHADIKALQPGELLVCKNGRMETVKWFHYIPEPDNTIQGQAAQQDLGICLDNIFSEVIKRSNGRPIWIPLSGGLDSRIILCKLHELGYRNINTFSYGPRFNFESYYARKIARKLNIPWQFVPVSNKQARAMFTSPERLAFWNNAQNLKATPSMREYSAIVRLHEQKIMPNDAIIINGQSGDYITGNHISALWKTESDVEKLFPALLKKHYALFPHLLTPENIKALTKRIKETIPEKALSQGWIAEEVWEYEGRQVCLVINGQRIYDELGYDWELPLWEKSLVDFYEPIPFDQKFGQKLYKDYLRTYNYKGLFPAKEPSIWRWPIPMLWVLPMAQLIGFIKGSASKERFYNLMKYFGHYSNQWAFFPFSLYRKNAQKIRNVFSFYVLQWLKENPGSIPADMHLYKWKE